MGPILSPRETVEAYEAAKASARPKQSMLVHVVAGVAWVSMAVSVALFIALIAQVFGVNLI